MNEQDFRDVCAILRGTTGATPEECYKFADEMLEIRDAVPSAGLPPIKRRGRPRNDSRID